MKPLSRKKLLPLLIAHYERVIGELNQDNWEDIILKNNVQFGICNAALSLFKRNIYNTKWVKKECTMGGSMWGYYPEKANSVNGCKELLQIRVDKMKKILAGLTK
jgi:hypothetical protein